MYISDENVEKIKQNKNKMGGEGREGASVCVLDVNACM